MTRPSDATSAEPELADDRYATEPTPPEAGGSQSGPQIDESEIDAPGDDHSPTTENDVT